MKEKIQMEIRPAEGGEDSKLLIKEMKNIYIKACKLQNFDYQIKEDTDSIIVI
jgi:protein subunit release factor A